MSQSANRKLRILFIYDILCRDTDDTHGITLSGIMQKLSRLDAQAERKAIYSDIELLRDVYGADIELVRAGGDSEYRLLSRTFELPELRLLVDAVQSSRFITERKTNELISKLESLTSRHGARALQGQVYVSSRIKNMNETIYYNVDAVNEAITENRQISFKYFEWTARREKKLRRDGGRYTVSPLMLNWDNENYYLIALENENIRHYRVDKMLDIRKTELARRQAESFDPVRYSKEVFGMFGGREEQVTLRCKNSLAGAIIDRFGQDIMTVPDGEYFTFTAGVKVSPQFFGWLCGLGDGVEVIRPRSVRDELAEHVKSVLKLYK